jgi:hypothetical protein
MLQNTIQANHRTNNTTSTTSMIDEQAALKRSSAFTRARMVLSLSMGSFVVVKQRVKPRLQIRTSFDRLGRSIATAGLIVLLGVSPSFLVSCQTRPDTYLTVARIAALRANDAAWSESELEQIYGSIKQLIESPSLKVRALERAVGLHPELKPCDLLVLVEKAKLPAEFLVSVEGGEPQFSRAFLEALLDEYMSVKEEAIRPGDDIDALTKSVEDCEKRWKTATNNLGKFDPDVAALIEQQRNAGTKETANSTEVERYKGLKKNAALADAHYRAAIKRLGEMELRSVLSRDVMILERSSAAVKLLNEPWWDRL